MSLTCERGILIALASAWTHGATGTADMDQGGVLRILRRGAFVLTLTVALSGCEMMSKSTFFRGFQSTRESKDTSALSEQGLGKLAKGDLLRPQALFDQALARNPRDVHALTGKGMVFRQTGLPTKARAAYEAVLALRPSDA